MGLMRIRPFWTAVLMFMGKAARYVVVAGVMGALFN
jgi:membrane protein YqaA with SNARE-associated domain